MFCFEQFPKTDCGFVVQVPIFRQCGEACIEDVVVSLKSRLCLPGEAVLQRRKFDLLFLISTHLRNCKFLSRKVREISIVQRGLFEGSRNSVTVGHWTKGGFFGEQALFPINVSDTTIM